MSNDEKPKREFVPRTPGVSSGIGNEGRFLLQDVLSSVLSEKEANDDYESALRGSIGVYVEEIAFTPLDNPKFCSLKDDLRDLVIALKSTFDPDKDAVAFHHDEHIRSMKIISRLLLGELAQRKSPENIDIRASRLINDDLITRWEKKIFNLA